MKTHFTQIALIAALSAAGATTAFAHTDYSEGGYSEAGSAHWLSHVAESRSQPTANQLAPYGYVASGGAGRVLNVDSGTKYINVSRLETVQINVGGKSVPVTTSSANADALLRALETAQRAAGV